MNIWLSFLLLTITCAQSVSAQNAFHFREAALLGEQMWHSGADYSAVNTQIAGREAPSPARQFIPDENDLNVYRSDRWLGLLSETDSFRRSGAFRLAEQQYFRLLDRLRQVQGQDSIEVGSMLAHIGEFYLEIREFEKAYQYLSEAVRIRRMNIQALSKSKSLDPNQQPDRWIASCRAQLVKLLVILGRLDFAKGDVAVADQELTAAISIGNQLGRLRDGLDAVYFESLLLEKQNKWQAAEAIWQVAVKAREKMSISDPNWDLMKEMAAFYARRGDYQTAATLAKRIQSETARKTLKPVLMVPNNVELGRDNSGAWAYWYKPESEIAMASILAVDRWITDGPDAAASLFTAAPLNRLPMPEVYDFEDGSDSQRARLLTFFTQRAYLHLSILLDGSPSEGRTAIAYRTIQQIKGAYLDTLKRINRLAESDRNNPAVSSMAYLDPVIMLDHLNKERARHAHYFVAAALDGKHFQSVDFAASEQSEQAVSEGLAYSLRNQLGYRLAEPSSFAPPDAAFIDVVAWERTERRAPTSTHREYGAFVIRKGEPIRYVRLGPATLIDADIALLESSIVGRGLRGPRSTQPLPPLTAKEMDQVLKRLYQEVVAPLEPSLTGIKKLIIAPDSKLTLAPIAAFKDNQGNYLLQRYTLSYVGSWRELLSDAEHSISKKTTPPVVIANPDFNAALTDSVSRHAPPNRTQFESLPFSQEEAGDVQKALHISPDRILDGKAAREASVQSLSGPEILHFATHSIPYKGWTIPTPSYDLFEFPKSLATEDPLLQSVIALAGSNLPQAGPEDGILTGLEAASLRLTGTRLVVLSTCEAGQGIPLDGIGVLGLRVAFSIAGAEGLVMSLWPIDDKAGRLFMQRFYSHLASGPAEAIRLAQLDMLSNSEFRAAVYWAGYAYSGNPASTGWQQVASAPTAKGSEEFLAAPACFELTTHSDLGNWRTDETYRLQIAGAVKRSSSSPERVVYDLYPPSSEFESSSATSVNHAPPMPNPEVHIASQHHFSVSLTIERAHNESALYIREYVPEGDYRYKPQTVTLITLKGGPELFPSFDIPSALPLLSSYSEASVSSGSDSSKSIKIESAGSCSTGGRTLH